VSVSFKTEWRGARYASGMSKHLSEHDFRQLPNVGPAVAQMLIRLGIERPEDLRGQDGQQLFQRLCDLDGKRHDPCLLDTFVAVVDHANGAPARPWWYYSRIRKQHATTSPSPDHRAVVAR
jgi:Pathogenicity locus